MQAVILAGGSGTRLQPFTFESPKPMYPINGRPFLDHLLDQISEFGITDVILLLGYKAQKIVDYLSVHPREGLHIEYVITPEDCDTGARIRGAAHLIHDDFLLMYCDNYCPISFLQQYQAFRNNHALVQMTAYANKDGYTKNNLRVEAGKVLIYDKDRVSSGLNSVDIGYAIIAHEVLTEIPEDENFNFERFVYGKALHAGRLYAGITEHRYYSIGSYARMELTQRFFSGRKALFLDRDGTINVRPQKACYVESPSDFVWLPNAPQAIKMFNDAGWLVLLVSNQPGLARGRLTTGMLDAIHKKMNADLIVQGAWIDKIYFCPHNWDEGCGCRKPNPGMLYQAQRDFDLNIPRDCLLIGDDERDIEAADRADCKSLLVSEAYSLWDAANDILSHH